MMTIGQLKQTRSEVKKLIKSKETAFQERQTEQTKGLCLLPRKESFLTPRFPLPLGFLLTLRSVLGSDPSMLKIDCLILRKTHQGHYNTPTHRGRISTGTKHNPPRPRTQQGFWNTESNEVFLVLFFSSELAALPVNTTRSRLTLPFKP